MILTTTKTPFQMETPELKVCAQQAFARELPDNREIYMIIRLLSIALRNQALSWKELAEVGITRSKLRSTEAKILAKL